MGLLEEEVLFSCGCWKRRRKKVEQTESLGTFPTFLFNWPSNCYTSPNIPGGEPGQRFIGRLWNVVSN